MRKVIIRFVSSSTEVSLIVSMQGLNSATFIVPVSTGALLTFRLPILRTVQITIISTTVDKTVGLTYIRGPSYRCLRLTLELFRPSTTIMNMNSITTVFVQMTTLSVLVKQVFSEKNILETVSSETTRHSSVRIGPARATICKAVSTVTRL